MSKILSHLLTSKVYLISSLLAGVGFRAAHAKGFDLGARTHSAIHISTSSSLAESLSCSITLIVGFSLSLFLLSLNRLYGLTSLARFSCAQDFCKTWLTSENSCPSNLSLI